MFKDATEDMQSKLTLNISYCFFVSFQLACHILNIEGLYSDLRQTIAMTTTAIMKTKLAVIDPTMSGNCSCHGFVGSALRIKLRKWVKE